MKFGSKEMSQTIQVLREGSSVTGLDRGEVMNVVGTGDMTR